MHLIILSFSPVGSEELCQRSNLPITIMITPNGSRQPPRVTRGCLNVAPAIPRKGAVLDNGLRMLTAYFSTPSH